MSISYEADFPIILGQALWIEIRDQSEPPGIDVDWVLNGRGQIRMRYNTMLLTQSKTKLSETYPKPVRGEGEKLPLEN